MEQKKKQKLNFISEEKRLDYIKKIIAFFIDERNEEIGVIAAGNLFDYFVEEVGKDIYKRGIKDARKLVDEKNEDLKIDLDLLSE